MLLTRPRAGSRAIILLSLPLKFSTETTFPSQHLNTQCFLYQPRWLVWKQHTAVDSAKHQTGTSFYYLHLSRKIGNKLQIFLPNSQMTQSPVLYSVEKKDSLVCLINMGSSRHQRRGLTKTGTMWPVYIPCYYWLEALQKWTKKQTTKPCLPLPHGKGTLLVLKAQKMTVTQWNQANIASSQSRQSQELTWHPAIKLTKLKTNHAIRKSAIMWLSGSEGLKGLFREQKRLSNGPLAKTQVRSYRPLGKVVLNPLPPQASGGNTTAPPQRSTPVQAPWNPTGLTWCAYLSQQAAMKSSQCRSEDCTHHSYRGINSQGTKD